MREMIQGWGGFSPYLLYSSPLKGQRSEVGSSKETAKAEHFPNVIPPDFPKAVLFHHTVTSGKEKKV